jgi:hypothetical protein
MPSFGRNDHLISASIQIERGQLLTGKVVKGNETLDRNWIEQSKKIPSQIFFLAQWINGCKLVKLIPNSLPKI